jgi:hypothetical protein
MYVQGLLTLTGSAQALSTSTGTCAAYKVTAGALGNLSCKEIHIQPSGSNAESVKFGDANITTGLFAFQLPAGTSGEPPAPFVMGPFGNLPIHLKDLYALGAAGETVHLGLVL